MRVSSGFLRVVINAPNQDQIIEIKLKDKVLKMRIIKFELEENLLEKIINVLKWRTG